MSGWAPGSPVTTPSVDPSVTPNPADIINGHSVLGLVREVVTGSAGAMIAVAAGVLALTKGWEMALNSIRAKRRPQQLTLF